MRVAMLTDTFLPKIGGAEIAAAELCNALHDLGIDVVLVTPYSGRAHVSHDIPDFPIRFPIENVKPRSFLFLSMAKALLKSRLKPDIIHAHFLYPSGFAALTTKPFLRRPCIVTIHGKDIQVNRSIGYGMRQDWRLDLIIRAVLRNVDALHAPSKLVGREAFLAGADRSKIHIIPNGVDIVRFNPFIDGDSLRKRLGISADGHMVLTISRFHPKKGHALLVRAIPMVLKEYPETKFVFCGEGSGRQTIVEMVKSNGLSKNVIFAGFIDEKEKPIYYAASDIFVLPSLVENAPVVVPETLASGKPIVASNTGNIPEIIHNGSSGLIVDPNDPFQLAEAIIKYLKNSSLRRSGGRIGRENIVKNYSWRAISEKILALYEDLV